MIPYHIYIQVSNSRKKNSNFIFYAYFLKDYFRAPVQKLFSTKWRDFFQKIKITIYVAQNLILTNETPLKSMILSRFSFGSFRFGGPNAKIMKKYRSYWFSLRPLGIASLKLRAASRCPWRGIPVQRLKMFKKYFEIYFIFAIGEFDMMGRQKNI